MGDRRYINLPLICASRAKANNVKYRSDNNIMQTLIYWFIGHYYTQYWTAQDLYIVIIHITEWMKWSRACRVHANEITTQHFKAVVNKTKCLNKTQNLSLSHLRYNNEIILFALSIKWLDCMPNCASDSVYLTLRVINVSTYLLTYLPIVLQLTNPDWPISNHARRLYQRSEGNQCETSEWNIAGTSDVRF